MKDERRTLTRHEKRLAFLAGVALIANPFWPQTKMSRWIRRHARTFDDLHTLSRLQWWGLTLGFGWALCWLCGGILLMIAVPANTILTALGCAIALSPLAVVHGSYQYVRYQMRRGP